MQMMRRGETADNNLLGALQGGRALIEAARDGHLHSAAPGDQPRVHHHIARHAHCIMQVALHLRSARRIESARPFTVQHKSMSSALVRVLPSKAQDICILNDVECCHVGPLILSGWRSALHIVPAASQPGLRK